MRSKKNAINPLNLPRNVNVFEVGPRDGLQNESSQVRLGDKLFLIRGLLESGVKNLELGSFVRADRVPQMSDTADIYSKVKSGSLELGRAKAWALVPNLRGLEDALASGVKGIAVFTAASDSFTNANIGMSVKESLVVFKNITKEARRRKIKIRGYVSTAFGCPYEGRVSPKKAIRVIKELLDFGVDEVSVGDTIGVASPKDVVSVFGPLQKEIEYLAGHFHDTRGGALANALAALQLGVKTIDSSVGGLGGCPYAPGASGNLATEDLVYMLSKMGIRTEIDFEKLYDVSFKFSKRIGRAPTCKSLIAWAGKKGLLKGAI